MRPNTKWTGYTKNRTGTGWNSFRDQYGVLVKSIIRDKNESTLVIQTRDLEEIINVPFEVHPEVLLGSPVQLHLHKHNSNYNSGHFERRIVGWDGGDPIMHEVDTGEVINYTLTVLGGEYIGTVCRGSWCWPYIKRELE